MPSNPLQRAHNDAPARRSFPRVGACSYPRAVNDPVGLCLRLVFKRRTSCPNPRAGGLILANMQQYRSAFITQLNREVQHADEQQRFVQVLDHFIQWSALRPGKLGLADVTGRQHVVSFNRVADGAVFWTAYARDRGAKLEILPRARTSLSAERLQDILAVIGSVTVEPVSEETPLRIPFAALKNADARARVTDLLQRILADPCETIVRKPIRTRATPSVAAEPVTTG